MEKLSEILKNKLFKFVPKRPMASVANFQNPTLSPSRSVTTTKGCRSSVSIIPKEARRKHRSVSFSARGEPSSPKVSCMGQVQCKKKRKAKRVVVDQHSSSTKKSYSDHSVPPCHVNNKEKVLLWILKGISGEGPTQSEKALVLKEKEVKAPSTTLIAPAPSLGTMKKFASGRGSLSDFDVTLAER